MKKKSKKFGEIERLFDSSEDGYILGVDIAGISQLAGPVIAVACCLPKTYKPNDLKGFKKIADFKIEKLYHQIKSHALALGIAIINVETIDTIGIQNAYILAMNKAMTLARENAIVRMDTIVTNGKFKKGVLHAAHHGFVNGSERSWNIAAAALVAYVMRNKLMDEYHIHWPEYNFHKNKGYNSQRHRQALKKYGPCELHRKSFEQISNLLR